MTLETSTEKNKEKRMRTFIVLTGEVHGALKTALVEEDTFEGNPEDYFIPSAENVEKHGTIQISGEAEHMIPDDLVEG